MRHMVPHLDISEICLPVKADIDLDLCIKTRRTVIVLSPHPDDDVIGMGGTMTLLSAKKFAVFSLYVTDGDSQIFKRTGIARVRHKEALDALAVVGATAGLFLNHATARLAKSYRLLVHQLKNIFCYFMPREIYIPSLFERHPTHVLVTRAALQALKHLPDPCLKIWGYHVWSCGPRTADAKVVDITAVLSTKRKAIKMHRSQLAIKPYDSGTIGKNHYDAVFLDTHKKTSYRYVELFIDLRPFRGCTAQTLRNAAAALINKLVCFSSLRCSRRKA